MSDAPRPPEGAAGPFGGSPGADSVHEVALRELLRSPLDDEPGRRRGESRGRGLTVAIFLVAAAAGAGIAWGVAALVGSEAKAAPTTTAAPSTTTTTAAAGPALPAGYAPVGEGFGARAERVLVRDDAVFVTLSFAADEGRDPAETAGHEGGQWQLEFPDGTTVRSTGVVFDAVARAAATIVFPAFDRDPATATLRLLSADDRHTATFSAAFAGTVPALPADGARELTPEPATFALDGGGTLRLDSLVLTAAGGTLAWSVEGDGVAAHVQPGVSLEGSNGAIVLILEDPFFQFRNRTLSDPPPLLATAGTAVLVPLDATRTDPGADFTVQLEFGVTWAVSLPADAAVPLAGVPVVDITTAG